MWFLTIWLFGAVQYVFDIIFAEELCWWSSLMDIDFVPGDAWALCTAMEAFDSIDIIRATCSLILTIEISSDGNRTMGKSYALSHLDRKVVARILIAIIRNNLYSQLAFTLCLNVFFINRTKQK